MQYQGTEDGLQLGVEPPPFYVLRICPQITSWCCASETRVVTGNSCGATVGDCSRRGTLRRFLDRSVCLLHQACLLSISLSLSRLRTQASVVVPFPVGSSHHLQGPGVQRGQ